MYGRVLLVFGFLLLICLVCALIEFCFHIIISFFKVFNITKLKKRKFKQVVEMQNKPWYIHPLWNCAKHGLIVNVYLGGKIARLIFYKICL